MNGFATPTAASVDADLDGRVTDTCAALLDRPRGTVSRRAATEVLDLVENHGERGRLALWRHLHEDLGPDRATIESAIEAWRDAPDQRSAADLNRASEPPRQRLLRSLTLAADGPYRLVELRASLLDLLPARPELGVVDEDFRHLFHSWFSPGFLHLREVSWDSPSSLVEHVLRHESVHPMEGWAEIRSRLEPADRTCFAFVHPTMGERPLIFVEVALCADLSADLEFLRPGDQSTTGRPTTACLYSINNTFRGLRGVPFGYHLIKQVIAHVQERSPWITTFATLSPVPGLRAWMETEAAHDTRAADLLVDVRRALASGRQDDLDAVRPPFLAVARRYLLEETDERNRRLDPVARFHLGNGAALHRLNWPAGDAGYLHEQSFGLMVNYRYDALEAS